MFFRLCVLVLYTLSFVAMAEDFSKELSDALLKGIKQEDVDKTLKALSDNGIDNRYLLCLSSKEDLKKEVGLSFVIANVILDFCKPAKAPVKPVDVELDVSDLAKWSVLKLLNRLATNSQDTNALEALQGKSLVKKAQARTTAWAVVDIDENSKRTLDAQATLDYLRYLNLPTQPALLNKTREGKLIESIDILGKVDGQILLHPLFDNHCITMGYDETGLDWSKVPSEVMKALLWGRETGHSAFLRLNRDAARVYGEVAKEKIDDVFIKEIIEDYQLAVKRKERHAMLTTLDPSQAQLAACKKKH
jgi:hypothetical protein